MFELLLYADIQCTDAADIIRRLDAHEHITMRSK